MAQPNQTFSIRNTAPAPAGGNGHIPPRLSRDAFDTKVQKTIFQSFRIDLAIEVKQDGYINTYIKRVSKIKKEKRQTT